MKTNTTQSKINLHVKTYLSGCLYLIEDYRIYFFFCYANVRFPVYKLGAADDVVNSVGRSIVAAYDN